jgi:hypothetical protein
VRQPKSNLSKEPPRLFAAFVDFSKAYDSVWRAGLFYKLVRCRISSKLVAVVRDMYRTVTCAIRSGGSMSDAFEQFVALRQGCVLSPFLFSLYIEDFPRWLESELPGVGAMLGDRLIQCLTYADDIVLTAMTADELQLMLNKLDEYCNRWRLMVNVKKTEVMVFQTKSTLRRHPMSFEFFFQNRLLNIVESFKYLGIVFRSDGSLELAMKRVAVSARKAFFLFSRPCSSFTLGASMCNKLYQTFIFSILSYGAELWGVSVKTHFEDLEQVQTMVGRFILGVGKKTPEIGVLGELGWNSVRCCAVLRAISYWSHLLRLPE